MYTSMWIPTIRDGMKEAAAVLERTTTRVTQFFQITHQPTRNAGSLPTQAPGRTRRQTRAAAAQSTRNMTEFITATTIPAARNRVRAPPPTLRRRRRPESESHHSMMDFVVHPQSNNNP